MIDLQPHLEALGPLAILLAAGIEGQTGPIMGGVMAREDVVPFVAAVGLAALGSMIAVQLMFFAGRSCRQTRFVRKVAAKPAFEKALKLIERHPSAFVLSVRFLFGLRAVGPVAIGVCDVSLLRFTLLNLTGALIWAVAYVALGYFFGPAVMSLLTVLKAHAGQVAIGLAVIGLIALGVWRWRVWTAARAA